MKQSRRILARTVANKLLAEPAKQSHWIKATAAYIVDQRMAADVDLILNDIAHELYEQSGHLFVDVASARKVSDQVKRELKGLLVSATGAKHVELTERVDPSLLGGLIARTPDHQLDVSVRTKLKQLRAI